MLDFCYFLIVFFEIFTVSFGQNAGVTTEIPTIWFPTGASAVPQDTLPPLTLTTLMAPVSSSSSPPATPPATAPPTVPPTTLPTASSSVTTTRPSSTAPSSTAPPTATTTRPPSSTTTPPPPAPNGTRIIRVGAMFPRGLTNLDTTISYSRTAGGLTVGMNKIFKEQILPNTNFSFTFFFDQCNEAQASGGAISLIRDSHVDVIIGPACSSSVSMAGTIGAYYNFPVFAWSTVLSAELSNTAQYPTLASTSVSTYTLVQALGEVFRVFEWNEFAFFYAVVIDNASPRCAYIQSDMDSYVSTNDNMTMVYKRDTSKDSYTQLRTSLRRMKTQARIIAACYEFPADKRTFMEAAMDENMTTNDYVFIFIQTVQTGFGQVPGSNPFWIDATAAPDGRDAQVKKACEKVLIVDLQPLPTAITSFYEDAKAAMFDWPINCNGSDCPPSGVNMTKQAAYLTDTFYMYALAVNRSIRQFPNDPYAYRNGSLIQKNVVGSFSGFSGGVRMNSNGTREPSIQIIGLDGNGNQKTFYIVERKDNSTSVWLNIIAQFQDEKVVWANRGGIRPLSHPVCDFDGSACPPSFIEANLGVVIGVVILIIAFIIILILAVYYSIRVRQENRRKMDELWQIAFVRLIKPDEKDRDLAKSSRSMISSISSTSTKLTHTSKKDTEHFEFYLFEKETIVAKKHAARPRFTEKDHVMFRAMQQMNHDNLCRFIGLSMDGPMYLSLWKYCSRGCLRDVIERNQVTMDGFFMISLIRDISEGISFLHNSPLFHYHGEISSRTCLVDERWQVKITLYGLYPFKFYERNDAETLLWCAPEVIRSDGEFQGSASADIYSFAITASEIVTQKPVWGLGESELDPEEIIYRVKKGGKSPIRPNLAVESAYEINSSLLHLIRDCWAEEPNDRPNIKVVQTLLKSMHTGKARNLMDHVFSILEQYANNLEQEVEVRTRELGEEKKKSDILLYRMLPKSAADKLKLGQSVEPESFESVTIFFSDVVSFTTLASRCTPLQVVNLLNDLYSTFDTIIDEHNCYKVETIGDGYLCVSGLPTRNGDRHAADIAEMSKGFLKAIKKFKIPHLPNERVNIRIGLHTGSCVAGVVGLSMPRYCLFGDTVNTGSRMESNGKPGRIHISSTTNHYLTKIIGGYETVSRGEVIIKGKGVMETFFLITGDPEDNLLE